MVFVDILPRWERCLYWTVGVGGIFYSIYRLYLEGGEHTEALKETAVFTSGWSWTGRVKDETDTEFQLLNSMLGYMILTQLGHSLLTLACLHLKLELKTRKGLLLTFDMLAACYFYGGRIGLLLITVGLLMYGVSYLNSVLLVWALGVFIIVVKKDSLLLYTTFSEMYQFNVIISNHAARLIGFNVDRIWLRRKFIKEKSLNFKRQTGEISLSEDVQPEQNINSLTESKNSNKISQLFGQSIHNSTVQVKTPNLNGSGEANSDKKLHKNDNHLVSSKGRSQDVWSDRDLDLLDQFFFVFYLPMFFIGPITPYKDFHQSFHQSLNETAKIWGTVQDVVKQLTKIGLYIVLVNLMLHFLYFGAVSQRPDIISSLSEWARHGVIYCQGQNFMVKYFIIFGMALQFSRIDGIHILSTPRCVSWVAHYSDIWRTFDVGIYKFVNRYIYVAAGGSRFGILRGLAAAALGFFFFFLWHGSEMRTFIWCFINFLVVILENFGRRLEQSPLMGHTKSYIGAAMYLRLKVLVTVPLHVASIFSICFFFFDESVAWIMVTRCLCMGSWQHPMPYFVIVYCCIHNAYYIAETRKTCCSRKTE